MALGPISGLRPVGSLRVYSEGFRIYPHSRWPWVNWWHLRQHPLFALSTVLDDTTSAAPVPIDSSDGAATQAQLTWLHDMGVLPAELTGFTGTNASALLEELKEDFDQASHMPAPPCLRDARNREYIMCLWPARPYAHVPMRMHALFSSSATTAAAPSPASSARKPHPTAYPSPRTSSPSLKRPCSSLACSLATRALPCARDRVPTRRPRSDSLRHWPSSRWVCYLHDAVICRALHVALVLARSYA